MPTRTIVEELCDVCFVEDDGLEAEATERLRFGWQDRNYVLLVCAEHVDAVRDLLQHFSEVANVEGGSSRRRRTPLTAPTKASRSAAPRHDPGKTLFSQLDGDEKERFRAWAEMPNARRIADVRVQEWITAGRP